MIVVCDTSTICYLILIDEVDLLTTLFGEILIPQQVYDELTSPGAPQPVRSWIATPPAWLKIHRAPPELEPEAAGLHAGERQALALARHLEADLIVLDDQIARQAASELGLRFTGLLGVLDRAAKAKKVNLQSAVRRLRQTNFRIAPSLLRRLLSQHLDL